MPKIVYGLSAILSLLCVLLLYRAYRKNSSRLLLFSALGFSFLTINNLILFVDLVVFPHWDFNGGIIRNICGAIGGGLILFTLIWETA